MESAADPKQCVYVVDDDSQIRIAMQALFDSVGLKNKTFASADEFLRHDPQDLRRMPGSGYPYARAWWPRAAG